MKAQDQIIHDSLRETKLADERLSPYATCNSDCIKVKNTKKKALRVATLRAFVLHTLNISLLSCRMAL